MATEGRDAGSTPTPIAPADQRCVPYAELAPAGALKPWPRRGIDDLPREVVGGFNTWGWVHEFRVRYQCQPLVPCERSGGIAHVTIGSSPRDPNATTSAPEFVVLLHPGVHLAVDRPYFLSIVPCGTDVHHAAINEAQLHGYALDVPIGRDPDAYLLLANSHMRPRRGGPTASWDLVLRKEDSCLLIIATHGDGSGRRNAREISVAESGRFDYDADKLTKLLGHHLPESAVARVMARSSDCPLHFRTLVRSP